MSRGSSSRTVPLASLPCAVIYMLDARRAHPSPGMADPSPQNGSGLVAVKHPLGKRFSSLDRPLSVKCPRTQTARSRRQAAPSPNSRRSTKKNSLPTRSRTESPRLSVLGGPFGCRPPPQPCPNRDAGSLSRRSASHLLQAAQPRVHCRPPTRAHRSPPRRLRTVSKARPQRSCGLS